MGGFEKRLHDLRKSKGLTQEELAGRLGVTPQAVSKWENGQSYPDITLLPAVAAVLDTDMGKLFGAKAEGEGVFFPEKHAGLALVHQCGNVACYSDKEVASTDGTSVKFTDGSTTELSTRLVRNAGRGEIRLLASGGADEADDSEKSADYEFPFADSLDVEVVGGRCEVSRSNDGKAHVMMSGSGRFIRHHRVSEIEGTLAVRCDDHDAVLRGGRHSNRLQIRLPCEKGRRARLCLNAEGGFEAALDFNDGDLVINGAGGIRAGHMEVCRVQINGSGSVRIDGAGEASLQINGSGSVDAGKLGEASVSVNGSGDIRAESAVSLNAQINGSGDVGLGEIRGGGVTFQASGSGDLHIGRGQCELFDVRLNGSGDADAEGVTARRASIVIENGEVRLGRVLEGSVEQIKKNGAITILNRGAE
ncbi:MAG: DUF2807 domain-containing protein [Oscillospiraceae bacterium]|jgi:transcriptional regulator with XRE-family HTH domain|nr:DUF2807 domain-containing protein [Oscillospiraceae bacterium]